MMKWCVAPAEVSKLVGKTAKKKNTIWVVVEGAAFSVVFSRGA